MSDWLLKLISHRDPPVLTDEDYDNRIAELEAESERLRHEFKNFHRLLCERFGYGHDDKDWERDQLSLIEHIAKSV